MVNGRRTYTQKKKNNNNNSHTLLDRFHPVRFDKQLLEVYEEIIQHLFETNKITSLSV